MSRTWTNTVRFAVAALLGLAACLVAWWPQSASGTAEAAFAPMVAAPTQKTPTPTKTPTATVAPPTTPTATVAPPPAQPTHAQPTHKPTHKPSHQPTHKPVTLHNSGGSQHHSSPPATHAPTSTRSTTVSTGAPYVPPASTPASTSTSTSTHTPSKPTKPASSAPTAPATTPVAADPTTPTAVAKPGKGKGTGAKDASEYDTYLTSSEPVETKSAPVWVVPGILLVLTSMLALLGGVLGRGNRPAVAAVKSSNETAEPTDS